MAWGWAVASSHLCMAFLLEDGPCRPHQARNRVMGNRTEVRLQGFQALVWEGAGGHEGLLWLHGLRPVT